MFVRFIFILIFFIFILKRYLVERKLLNLYQNNEILNVNQIYYIFLNENKNFLNQYLVYSHLKNLGYVIKKHSINNYNFILSSSINENENKFRNWFKMDSFFKNKEKEKEEENNIVDKEKEIKNVENCLIFNKFKENEKINLYSISKLFKLNQTLMEEEEEEEEEEMKLKIIFDIFKGGGTRNQKENPIYCLIIQNCLNKFPNIREIKRIKNELNNINILFSILDGSTIQLFLI